MKPIFLPLFNERNYFLPLPTLIKKTSIAPRKAPQIFMWNHPKTRQMIAYGVIDWQSKKPSPFHETKTPAITQLFALRGYIDNEDLAKLVERLEQVMIKSGYLTFGVALKASSEDRKKLEFLTNQGYTTEVFSEDVCSIYLKKRLELLE
jgi:hypothetical protein